MSGLFELFVAEWLRAKLPPFYELISQEQIKISETGSIVFKIDLVISETDTKKPICVLDTKYKKSESPTSEDIAQINLYAGLKNCRDAILVYPGNLIKPLDNEIKDVHIRSMAFSLEGDLEENGNIFLSQLLQQIEKKTFLTEKNHGDQFIGS